MSVYVTECHLLHKYSTRDIASTSHLANKAQQQHPWQMSKVSTSLVPAVCSIRLLDKICELLHEDKLICAPYEAELHDTMAGDE